jgi:hypothetical protein
MNLPCCHILRQGDFLVHLMESGETESSTPLSALAPHQLQGVLDAALRSSSLAASPHVDVVDGAVAIKVDKRSILQLITAATVSNSQGGQQVRRVGGFGSCSKNRVSWCPWAVACNRLCSLSCVLVQSAGPATTAVVVRDLEHCSWLRRRCFVTLVCMYNL